MSDNLPEPTIRHHKLFVKDPKENIIFDFCADALLIPVGHIMRIAPVPNMDAYYVTCRNGWRFSVSGPEIDSWDRDPLCVPDRGSYLD